MLVIKQTQIIVFLIDAHILLRYPIKMKNTVYKKSSGSFSPSFCSIKLNWKIYDFLNLNSLDGSQHSNLQL